MKNLLFTGILIVLFSLTGFAQGNPKGKLLINEEPGIIRLKNQYKEEAKNQKTAGYRVQIYNGGRKACETLRADFIKQFPTIKVQTVYESPEYKVQVGNYTTRLEAERFLNSLQETDFTGFVVRSFIEL